MVLGSFSPKKSHFAKIFKNARSYVFSNYVNVRNNSFTGLSTESFGNILVQK